MIREDLEKKFQAIGGKKFSKSIEHAKRLFGGNFWKLHFEKKTSSIFQIKWYIGEGGGKKIENY